MSKLQSKDFLNISCIIEDDESEYLRGVSIGKKVARKIVKNSKKVARVGTGLGALISGGIGYYLGKKLNNDDDAE
jgi:hypothetical protein